MLANIGSAEAIIILVALAVLFGNKKTTEIARGAGEATKELKKATKDFEDAVQELKKPIDETEQTDMKTESKTAKAEKTESTMRGGEEKSG